MISYNLTKSYKSKLTNQYKNTANTSKPATTNYSIHWEREKKSQIYKMGQKEMGTLF